MIVDGHLHLFRPLSVFERTVDDLAPADRDAPVEELLKTQAECGVDAAVAVPLGPEDDYLAEVLSRYPKRFAGIAVAPRPNEPSWPADRLAQDLARRHQQVQFHGLRVRWLGEPRQPLRDSPMYQALRWAADHSMVLWIYVQAEQVGLIQQLATEFPALTLVLNHLAFCPGKMTVDRYARPRFDERIPPPTLPAVLGLAAHRQVHLMLSGQYAFSRQPPPYHDLDRVLYPLVDAYGAHRTLWASDWPWTATEPGYAVLLDLPRQLLPDASQTELANILGGTASRLFPHLRATTGE